MVSKLLIPFILFFARFAPVHAHESVSYNDGDFSLNVLYYKGKLPKHIIIVPPTGGTNMIDRSYAKNLADLGFHVHVMNHWSPPDPINYELGIHRKFYGNAERAIELVVKGIPEAESVGILGTSVGGLHAAVATGLIPRIKTAMVITGGADIAGVIVYSDQKAMVDAYDKRREMYGFKNREEYYTALHKEIVLEPLRMKEALAGKNLALVISKEDTTVPGKFQLQLLDLWQPKDVLYLENDHFWTIVKTWFFHEDFVTGFFTKYL